jgi:hypothetical protein
VLSVNMRECCVLLGWHGIGFEGLRDERIDLWKMMRDVEVFESGEEEKV